MLCVVGERKEKDRGMSCSKAQCHELLRRAVSVVSVSSVRAQAVGLESKQIVSAVSVVSEQTVVLERRDSVSDDVMIAIIVNDGGRVLCCEAMRITKTVFGVGSPAPAMCAQQCQLC